MTKKRGDERIRLEAELREEPQVLARAVALLKDRTELLLDLAAKTLTRIVGPLAHDAAHVLSVERVAVTIKNKNVRKSTINKNKWRERVTAQDRSSEKMPNEKVCLSRHDLFSLVINH